MALLLPAADGIADHVERQLPQAAVLRYGQPGHDRLGEVTFYCLPYMGDAASVALLAELPRVQVVQSLSSGVDDVLGAVPPHAALCNGRGLQHEEGTAELAVTLVLASLRQLPSFVEQQSRRSWRHLRTDTLEHQRVLLVGYGAIGLAIQARLTPFGAQLTRVSRTARDGVATLPELPKLAAAADILIICIALSRDTHGLVSREVLAALPDGALVVNVARGPVVDAAALAAELIAGRLRAALDVTDVEPLPADRPEWSLPNVLITPHIGGDTFAFADRAPGFVAEQAARHLSGRPLANVVRPPLARPS
jgi:phosphoglycerate dehydrogenase-like enzyme